MVALTVGMTAGQSVLQRAVHWGDYSVANLAESTAGTKVA